MTFPRGHKGGATCATCEHNDGGTCQFKGELNGVRVSLVGLKVTRDDCCSAWDSPGTEHHGREGKSKGYDPSEPRDEGGKWTEGGGSSGGSGKAEAKPIGHGYGKLGGVLAQRHAAAREALAELFKLPRKERKQVAVAVFKGQLKMARDHLTRQAEEVLPKVSGTLAENTGLPEETFVPLKEGVPTLVRSVTDQLKTELSSLLGKIRSEWVESLEEAEPQLRAAYDLYLDGDTVWDSFEEPIGQIVDDFEQDRISREVGEDASEEEQDTAWKKVGKQSKQLELAIGATLVRHFLSPEDAGRTMQGRKSTAPVLAKALEALRRRLKDLDPAGHQHKPAGTPEGGQFTGNGGGGGGSAATAPAKLPHSLDGKGNTPNPALPDTTRPELDRAQAMALTDYTRGGYVTLNRALRTGGNLSEKDQDLRKQLDAALEKATPLEKPVTVHRGLDLGGGPPEAQFIEKIQAALKGKQLMLMGGYVSTSTDPKQRFVGSIRFEISARHGLDAKPYSNMPVESEFLMPHASKFRIKSVKPGKGGRGWVIKMEQVL